MVQLQAEFVDRLGVFASATCAAHCLICALVPGFLGVLGLGAFLSPSAEWGLTLAAVTFAGVSLAMGYRNHRSLGVAAVLLVGIIGLLTARSLEESTGHHQAEQHSARHHSHTEQDQGSGNHPLTPQAGDSQSGEKVSAGLASGSAVEDGGSHEGVSLHQLASLMSVLAGITLAIGHLLNIRATRCCEACG